MPTTLSAEFETRRAAEMTVERLVQEKGVERSDISVLASGPSNTVGDAVAGSDEAAASPSSDDRDDSPLNGSVLVSVKVRDDTRTADIGAAFAEFGAGEVTEE